ncbi:MAG: hypothetical protein K2J77_13165 [Oscillospiraceae bacterium]|nr:hypothetical protein [Oscillospiraceae bacterium]
MTLEELNEYNIIKAHIEQCRDKIREISSETIRSPIFDTSGISNSPSSRNPTEEKYIRAMAKKEMYEQQIVEDMEKITRIEKYISSIRDRRTRMIFEMRIYENEKFFKIAMKFGGRNTEDSVKNIFYRYLKHNPRG